jgi:hypothetical protein
VERLTSIVTASCVPATAIKKLTTFKKNKKEEKHTLPIKRHTARFGIAQICPIAPRQLRVILDLARYALGRQNKAGTHDLHNPVPRPSRPRPSKRHPRIPQTHMTMPVGGDEDVLHVRVELHARHLCGELDRILRAGGAACGRRHARVVQDEAAVLALLVTRFNTEDIYWEAGTNLPVMKISS